MLDLHIFFCRLGIFSKEKQGKLAEKNGAELRAGKMMARPKPKFQGNLQGTPTAGLPLPNNTLSTTFEVLGMVWEAYGQGRLIRVP